jgi:hypothetical protein
MISLDRIISIIAKVRTRGTGKGKANVITARNKNRRDL